MKDYNDFNEICDDLDRHSNPNIYAYAGYVKPSHIC